LAGRWPQADVHLAQARDLGEQLGTGLDEENYLQTLLAVYRGEFATIGPVVDDGLRRAEELDDSWGRRVYGGLSGQMALATGNYAQAAEIFGALAAALRSQGLVEPLATRSEPDWIEACVGVGDLDTAAVALEVLAGRHNRLPRPWTTLALARSRVLLAAASGGDTVPLIAELTAARDAVPPEVLPLDRARCLLVAGIAHRRAKRKKEAREALTTAAREFTELGAAAFAARAEAELARVGARVTAALDLTATEERVARLAAQGRTNRVIAETLFISPKTVEANLARVYRKLGIATRAELGAVMGQPDGR
jgi:DNA-binding CsgD family transcriptional regulator